MTTKVETHTGAEKRAIRGLKIYLERGSEIEDLGSGFYRVPGSEGKSYVVYIGIDHDTCECVDYRRLMDLPGPTMACKHIAAATIKRAKTR